MGPKLVISRHPENARETFRRRFERELQMLERLAEISGENQPVVAVMLECLESLSVLTKSDVKIADGV